MSTNINDIFCSSPNDPVFFQFYNNAKQKQDFLLKDALSFSAGDGSNKSTLDFLTTRAGFKLQVAKEYIGQRNDANRVKSAS